MPFAGCLRAGWVACNKLLQPRISTKPEKTVVMSSKAKTIARRLLRKNRGTRPHAGIPWRTIAIDDFGGKINHATLCRFAVSEGEWIPKDEDLQIVLGLKHPRKAKAHKHCDLFDMPTPALLKSLINREPMPPIDMRVFNAFKRAGFFTRSKARPTQ